MNAEVPPRPAAPPRANVNEISRATLEGMIGLLATWSAIGFPLPPRFREQPILIPDNEALLPGDVILKKRKKKEGGGGWWSRLRDRLFLSDLIVHVQREYGCPHDHCEWTHVMLYVGQLHVIEANKTADTQGVRVRPLTAYTKRNDFLVLRFKDPQFESKRELMVRKALLENAVRPRFYDVYSAWRALIGSRSRPKRHDTHVNCSEYVLKCYMEVSELVGHYMAIANAEDRFFYPAHWAGLEEFEEVKMTYRRLAVPSESQSQSPSQSPSQSQQGHPGDGEAPSTAPAPAD